MQSLKNHRQRKEETNSEKSTSTIAWLLRNLIKEGLPRVAGSKKTIQKREIEKDFHRIFENLKKEGTSKVDKELYAELDSLVKKTQQEINQLRLRNQIKKDRIGRLKGKLSLSPSNRKASGERREFNLEGGFKNSGAVLFNPERFGKSGQDKYLQRISFGWSFIIEDVPFAGRSSLTLRKWGPCWNASIWRMGNARETFARTAINVKVH